MKIDIEAHLEALKIRSKEIFEEEISDHKKWGSLIEKMKHYKSHHSEGREFVDHLLMRKLRDVVKYSIVADLLDRDESELLVSVEIVN